MIKKFFKNEEKRTITCKLGGYDNLYFKLQHLPGVTAIRNELLWRSKLKETEEIFAVATCHPEDTYDETKGVNIASKRADIKFHQEKKENLSIIKKKLLEEVRDIENLIKKEERVLKDLREVLKSYYGEADSFSKKEIRR